MSLFPAVLWNKLNSALLNAKIRITRTPCDLCNASILESLVVALKPTEMVIYLYFSNTRHTFSVLRAQRTEWS